eukprot:11657844-Prorocentrum_lima.AAC.1
MTSESVATSCRKCLSIPTPTLECWSVFASKKQEFTTPIASLICSTTDATRCCKQLFVNW